MAQTVKTWRDRWYEVIFEADTHAGKTFDILLLVAILLSVLTVILDSVASIEARIGELLYSAEWFFTILFTVEYVLRLWSVARTEQEINDHMNSGLAGKEPGLVGYWRLDGEGGRDPDHQGEAENSDDLRRQGGSVV